MGTRRFQQISDFDLCRRYRDGEARSMLSLRAHLTDAEVVAVLKRNGVPLRSDAESRALAAASRLRHMSTLGLRVRQRRA